MSKNIYPYIYIAIAMNSFFMYGAEAASAQPTSVAHKSAHIEGYLFSGLLTGYYGQRAAFRQPERIQLPAGLRPDCFAIGNHAVRCPKLIDTEELNLADMQVMLLTIKAAGDSLHENFQARSIAINPMYGLSSATHESCTGYMLSNQVRSIATVLDQDPSVDFLCLIFDDGHKQLFLEHSAKTDHFGCTMENEYRFYWFQIKPVRNILQSFVPPALCRVSSRVEATSAAAAAVQTVTKK